MIPRSGRGLGHVKVAFAVDRSAALRQPGRHDSAPATTSRSARTLGRELGERCPALPDLIASRSPDRLPVLARDAAAAFRSCHCAAAPSDVNGQVLTAAEARRVFVNAVDDPPNATAYAGGVVRRSGVTVAISTDGRAPALAGLLREALDSGGPVRLHVRRSGPIRYEIRFA